MMRFGKGAVKRPRARGRNHKPALSAAGSAEPRQMAAAIAPAAPFGRFVKSPNNAEEVLRHAAAICCRRSQHRPRSASGAGLVHRAGWASRQAEFPAGLCLNRVDIRFKALRGRAGKAGGPPKGLDRQRNLVLRTELCGRFSEPVRTGGGKGRLRTPSVSSGAAWGVRVARPCHDGKTRRRRCGGFLRSVMPGASRR